MKIRILFSLILISTLIYSCKKDSPQPTSTNFFVTALKNNSNWSGSPFVGTFHDTLNIQGNAKEEILGMKIKFTNTGTYTLTGGQVFDWSTVGGGVIIAAYKLRTDTLSSMTITSYDPTNNLIEGTFELKLIQSYPVSANPVKVSLTNGKFRSPLVFTTAL